jgi:two-component system LytT family response regulator
MKVLLIDNEIPVREALKKLIANYCPMVNNLDEANGVTEGLLKISSFEPDIVFLDVEMDDGTGFDLLRKLENYNFQLIFVTAHNKYAVDAFKFSAIDFLLKPIDPLELIKSINRAVENIKTRELSHQIEILKESLESLNQKADTERRIALNDTKSIHYIKVKDIIRCEANGAYTSFYISGNRKITASHTLKDYEELLEGLGFLRCHHSHIINISKILRFDKAEGGTLILENDQIAPVSSRKKDHVLELLNKK